MARFSLSTGTQLIAERTLGTVMPSGEDAITSVVFQIWSATGGFSTIPRIAVEDTAQTPINVQYYNVQTGSPVAAGTPITANGIYAVYAPCCEISLVTSAGTATCEADRVYGRAF